MDNLSDFVTDLGRLTHAVGILHRRQDWHLKAKAVLSFEFSSIAAFKKAEFALRDAIFRTQVPTAEPRVVSSATIEIDYGNLTFRLTCHDRIATYVGDMIAVGATEVLSPDYPVRVQRNSD